MSVVAVVQARMGSTRLPGKVLLPLGGEPVLARIIARVGRAQRVDEVLVATSTDAGDDAIARLCAERGTCCARGPLHDVLARFASAVPPRAALVVRITADCPLVDPELIDRHVAAFDGGAPIDYASNGVVRTMPDGFDVEAFTRPLLEAAARGATAPFDREHVTPWMQRYGRVHHVTQAVDLSPIRLTLDDPRDRDVLDALLRELPADFAAPDVYRALLRRPDRILAPGSAAPREHWCARIAAHLAER